jgi:hypothetical protein
MPSRPLLIGLLAAALLAAAGPAAAANSGPRLAVELGRGPGLRSTVFEVTTFGPCVATGGLDLCYRARLEASAAGRRIVSRRLSRPSVFSAYRAIVRWPCAVSGRIRWGVVMTDTDTGRTARRAGSVTVARCQGRG